MADFFPLTASQAAAAIRAGEATSVEFVEALLVRIAKYNQALNAVVTLDAEGARRTARLADAAWQRGENWGPLHGVPITIKDSLLPDYPTNDYSTITRRLLCALAIVPGA